MAADHIGDLAMRLSADIALLELCCARVTAIPSHLGEYLSRPALCAIDDLANLIDQRLVPSTRRLGEGLCDYVRVLSELLELLPYLNQPETAGSVRAQIGRLLDAGSVITRSQGGLAVSTMAALQLELDTLDAHRVTGTYDQSQAPVVSAAKLRLAEHRRELQSYVRDPERRWRIHLRLIPADSGAPQLRTQQTLSELIAAIDWVSGTFAALDAAWVRASAEMKAAAAGLEWDGSTKARFEREVSKLNRTAQASWQQASAAHRWLLHFDVAAAAQSMPVPATTAPAIRSG